MRITTTTVSESAHIAVLDHFPAEGEDPPETALITDNITQWEPAEPASINGKGAKASSASRTKPPAICPWCGDEFSRRKEVERHSLSTHLPCWLFCPRRSCPWRGSRREELKKHLEQKSCSTETKPEEFMIYDPKWIFDFIFDNSTDTPINSRLKVGEEYALSFVGERMMELQKPEPWDDLWGRRLKGT